MTLYLKYRPQDLDELDIASVRESLKKIVASDNIPHAFLFSGPKGTGKTSTARILAKIINCEGKNRPCNSCEQCVSITNGSNLDVIELDAASHRGIDDIRVLREGVKLAPTSAKKKVYIIDEAHMLTTEASNALLKTLEEPPAHVVFILATTNAEKLISTIHSRTTKINFTKATDEEIRRSLDRVVKGEKIKIEDELLDTIANEANGSFRDGVKLLESFTLEGDSFLTKSKEVDIDSFVNLLYDKDQDKLLAMISSLVTRGVSLESFIKNLLLKLRADLLSDTKKSGAIELIELVMEVPSKMITSPIEELPLEIAIIKYCNAGAGRESKVVDYEVEEKVEKKDQETKVKLEIKGEMIDDDKWRAILAKIKPINASIEALLRSSRPLDFDGKVLRLGVFYKFHKERLEDARNRKILEEVVEELFGSPVRVNCLLTDPPVQEIKKTDIALTENKDQDIIKVAEAIFNV